MIMVAIVFVVVMVMVVMMSMVAMVTVMTMVVMVIFMSSSDHTASYLSPLVSLSCVCSFMDYKGSSNHVQ